HGRPERTLVDGRPQVEHVVDPATGPIHPRHMPLVHQRQDVGAASRLYKRDGMGALDNPDEGQCLDTATPSPQHRATRDKAAHHTLGLAAAPPSVRTSCCPMGAALVE